MSEKAIAADVLRERRAGEARFAKAMAKVLIERDAAAARVKELEKAIALLTMRTATGQLCFRTSNGVPMGMHPRRERRVEALLTPATKIEK